MESADSITRMDNISRNSVSIVGAEKIFKINMKIVVQSTNYESNVQGHSLSYSFVCKLIIHPKVPCAFLLFKKL